MAIRIDGKKSVIFWSKLLTEPDLIKISKKKCTYIDPDLFC
jgi:hypothetical protein